MGWKGGLEDMAAVGRWRVRMREERLSKWYGVLLCEFSREMIC
jgi:hypothetical protein